MATAPYDILNTIINAARVRLNDAIKTLQPVSGQLLENSQPFTQQVSNSGWRKLQEFLSQLGYVGTEQETIITALPACTTTDPAIQVVLSYAGYFDGTVQQTSPVLPQTLVRPYELWERASGTTSIMTDMDLILNGLPAVPKLVRNVQWEWRSDALYMPGALINTDLRIRYGAFFPDFVDTGSGASTVPWYQQPVPIMRCLDSYADYMCREIMIAVKEDAAAAAFQASAEANARLLVGRDTKQPKAIGKASEYGRMQDRYTPNAGEDTQPVKR